MLWQFWPCFFQFYLDAFGHVVCQDCFNFVRIQNPSISLEVLVLGDAFSGFGIVEDLIDIVRADEISECENWAICKNHQYKKKSNILGLFLRYLFKWPHLKYFNQEFKADFKRMLRKVENLCHLILQIFMRANYLKVV